MNQKENHTNNQKRIKNKPNKNKKKTGIIKQIQKNKNEIKKIIKNKIEKKKHTGAYEGRIRQNIMEMATLLSLPNSICTVTF